ncbi:Carboxypeptidase G2 precursor [Corynebacterium glaucum]|uniref:Carboxypeptidase G2 n=1 Tax=Corynebacterium glaucum TaxID=187491 RepID=A0A1Q2HY36_9CORY|nr:M20 family metallopeptidase [Corynebacterium glaucum]AQQ15761.1 Carboxypeptidase G2 precursor [Corynebacterium glaucum]
MTIPESLAKDQLDQILKDAMELVERESPSTSKAHLDETLDGLLALTRERLGEPDHFERLPHEDKGDTAVLTYNGTQDANVLLVGHYDTVWPVGTMAEWNPPAVDASEDQRERLSGPGLYDMKIGLAQTIWALKLLNDSDTPRPTVTVIFNGDEEIGSPTSSPTIRAHAREATAAFVMEAPAAGGKVKVGRKGIGNIQVTATGIEAHAGLEPEKGASAITGLMEWCLEAVKLADPDAGRTINVGLIEGGTSANVTAGRATATLDIRHWDKEEPSLIDASLDRISISDERVSIAVDRDWGRPPMPTTKGIKRLFALLKAEAEAMGRELDSAKVGGGSDANFIADEGTPVICGMGADGGGAHARHEFIYPDSVPFFTTLLANGIAAVGREWS